MPPLRLRLAVTAALAAVLTLSACAQQTASEQWELAPVEIARVALDPEAPGAIAAGELVYRGGLEIRAAKGSAFGGVSGLWVDAENRLIAITDQGAWISATLERDAEGALTSLSDTKIAAMRDLEGAPLDSKRWADAEDLTRLPDGRYAVSFEQVHRIWAYDLDAEGPFARAEALRPLGGTEGMLANEGLEGIAALADGRLLGIAEFPPRGDDAPYWLFDPKAEGAAPPQGGYALTGGYGLVALAPLPNGDVLALERFYLPIIGVRVNVKHIPATAFAPNNRRIEGRVIATLEPPMALDNFEALAAVAEPDGNVAIFILSDNNFSKNQKTLLFAFDWRPETPVAALAALPEGAEDAVGGLEGMPAAPAASDGLAPAPVPASAPPPPAEAKAAVAAALVPAKPALKPPAPPPVQVAAAAPPKKDPPPPAAAAAAGEAAKPAPRPAAAKPRPKPPAAEIVPPAPPPPPPSPPPSPMGPDL